MSPPDPAGARRPRPAQGGIRCRFARWTGPRPGRSAAPVAVMACLLAALTVGPVGLSGSAGASSKGTGSGADTTHPSTGGTDAPAAAVTAPGGTLPGSNGTKPGDKPATEPKSGYIVYWDQDEEEDYYTSPGGSMGQLETPWDPNGQMCIVPHTGGEYVVGYDPTNPSQHNPGRAAGAPVQGPADRRGAAEPLRRVDRPRPLRPGPLRREEGRDRR